MPTFSEIQDVEPNVVDLTIHQDHPEISVRMPIYKMVETHVEDYLELRYKPTIGGGCQFAFNLSPALLAKLVDSQNALDSLPMMNAGEYPYGSSLGDVDCVSKAVGKLKAFHDSKGYVPHFAQYGK